LLPGDSLELIFNSALSPIVSLKYLNRVSSGRIYSFQAALQSPKNGTVIYLGGAFEVLYFMVHLQRKERFLLNVASQILHFKRTSSKKEFLEENDLMETEL